MSKEFFVIVGRGTATDCALQAENKTAEKDRRMRNERGDCSPALAGGARVVALAAPLATTGLKGIAP
jgi:hypothetical protein